ncbi:MAG: hypothetical protein JO282_06485 [Alphaproteobacteria bacterium]|nr:hypothetical protein [Alphaproteobacteria bacterium]
MDADSIAFVDPESRKEVGAALSPLAAYRLHGGQHLTLESRGTSNRSNRVGNFVGVPLWKASYRLSLPGDPKADRARLQSWAILDNFSGPAWYDVSLILLSGNPVTFRQSLFESYYVVRADVPVEVAGVLRKLDAGGIESARPPGDATTLPLLRNRGH